MYVAEVDRLLEERLLLKILDLSLCDDLKGSDFSVSTECFFFLYLFFVQAIF